MVPLEAHSKIEGPSHRAGFERRLTELSTTQLAPNLATEKFTEEDLIRQISIKVGTWSEVNRCFVIAFR